MKTKQFAVKLAAMAMFVMMSVLGAYAGSSLPTNANEALASLMKGNKHYVEGDLNTLEKNSSAKARLSLATAQHPYAIILACSDSRVPPEILFDKGLGEIFVIRVAGNVVSPHELGSIEYAAEHFGTPLVMVLGHERCGAVTAAYNTVSIPEGNIGSILESIAPAVTKAKAVGGTIEDAIDENIELVAENLESQSPIIKEFVESGKLKIVKAKYDLDTGKVTLR